MGWSNAFFSVSAGWDTVILFCIAQGPSKILISLLRSRGWYRLVSKSRLLSLVRRKASKRDVIASTRRSSRGVVSTRISRGAIIDASTCQNTEGMQFHFQLTQFFFGALKFFVQLFLALVHVLLQLIIKFSWHCLITSCRWFICSFRFYCFCCIITVKASNIFFSSSFSRCQGFKCHFQVYPFCDNSRPLHEGRRPLIERSSTSAYPRSFPWKSFSTFIPLLTRIHILCVTVSSCCFKGDFLSFLYALLYNFTLCLYCFSSVQSFVANKIHNRTTCTIFNYFTRKLKYKLRLEIITNHFCFVLAFKEWFIHVHESFDQNIAHLNFSND